MTHAARTPLITLTSLTTLTATLALTASALVLTACQSDDATDGPMVTHAPKGGHHDTPIVPAEPVAIHEMMTGNDPALAQPKADLIRSEDDLAALGSAELNSLSVDFDTQDVVLVALGQHPTGGYAAQINRILLEGPTLYVIGQAVMPAPDDMVTEALTYPYAVAVVEKTDAQGVVIDLRPAE